MNDPQNELSLLERFNAPTPKLFQKVRNAGIILASAAAAVLGLEAKGIIVPHSIEMIASLIATIAGTVTALFAQSKVDKTEYQIKKALE